MTVARVMEWARPAGWATFIACAALAVGRAVTASNPPPPRRLSDAEARAVGRAAAALEPGWRKTSVHNFPEDYWSQDDDFGASEHNWAVDEANRRGVPVGEIFRAIDADLHAHPPEPPAKSGASPCKPRPFYD
jgi:hypothetical protein